MKGLFKAYLGQVRMTCALKIARKEIIHSSEREVL